MGMVYWGGRTDETISSRGQRGLSALSALPVLVAMALCASSSAAVAAPAELHGRSTQGSISSSSGVNLDLPTNDTSTGASGDLKTAERIPNHYIVVLKDSVEHPGAIAETQTETHNGTLDLVYRRALKGYSAVLSKSAIGALRKNPQVKYIEPDRRVEVVAQTTPNGVKRIGAATNPFLDIDEIDDVRVNADVAVIDTGIDYTHPDLNVVGRTNCVPPGEGEAAQGCVDNSGTDGDGHGTHVAGTIGALDNGFGVVGVAPGARLWAVRVLNNKGFGYTSWVIAGIDWVTAHASQQIEVANMSLAGYGRSAAEEAAINASVEAGVVYVVAAGNDAVNAKAESPANDPNVITVSALADSDGAPGGGGAKCNGLDDTLAEFSNWGADVELAAPGTCIYSTLPVAGSQLGASYGTLSGTSMASPHVAGAAAVLASKSNPNSKKDVEAIRQTLINEGSLNWTDTSEDGRFEPLLYLGAESLKGLEVATGGWSSNGAGAATVTGAINPHGQKAEYRFEYGPTTAYGSFAPVSPGVVEGNYTAVSQQLEGLELGKLEHYRLSATTSSGTVYGKDKTLTPSLWSRQTPALPLSEEEELYDVSCSTETDCMAVGWRYNANEPPWNLIGSYRLSEGNWSYVPMPNPSGGSYTLIESVSCKAATSCVAVGKVQLGVEVVPLTELWDGSKWSILETPAPPTEATVPYAILEDISCVSASSCTAVGYFKKADVNPEHPDQKLWQTYVSRWSNGKWTNSFPLSPGSGYMEAVSCTSSTFCVAIGGTRLMTWDGSTWTSVTQSVEYGAVSCTSESFCLAVGYQPYVEVWNGTSWTAVKREEKWESRLLAVSCISPSDCVAGGYQAGHLVPAIEVWDGSAMKPQATQRDAEERGLLSALDCAPSHSCAAVGRIGEREKSLIVSTPDRRPVATTVRSSGVSSSQATVVGMVNPNGVGTSYHFEYGPTSNFGSSTPSKTLTAGTNSTEVSEVLTGLASGTQYFYRVVAESEGGTSRDAARVFTTPAVAATEEATGVSINAATLRGSVDPIGLESTYQFEYGTTTAYGQKAPASGKSVGSGVGYVPVSEAIKGLQTATTYHYRVLESNAKGTYFGEDRAFTTLAPCKGAEGKCEWKTQSSPDLSRSENSLAGVSCPSSTMCMGVGNDTLAAVGNAQLWNGTKWVNEFNLGNNSSAAGVSCPSTTWCMAVGTWKSGQARAFSLKEEASAWSQQGSAPATPSGGSKVTLRAVSCTSTTACTAVGSYYVESEAKYKTLVERWNGTSWSTQTSANPATGSAENAMLAVSCSSATSCLAVGTAGNAPYAETWNGENKWTAQTIPAPSPSIEATLTGISCTSSTACTAVGTNKESSTKGVYKKPLAERWNGTSWSIQTTPSPSEALGAVKLAAVSCTSSTACTAVGSYAPLAGETPEQQRTLAEAWNGTAWSVQASPNSAQNVNGLGAVSCFSSTACSAVGYAQPQSACCGSENRVSLAERWSGSEWKVQEAPTQSRSSYSLTDVSCAPTSAALCWAVGADKYAGTGIAELWNGTQWTKQFSLISSSADVSCPTTTWCMVVGIGKGEEAPPKAWNLREEGSVWSSYGEATVPTPAGGSSVTMRALSCSSTVSCTAVGYYHSETEGVNKPLVEHWNGTNWSLQTAPNPPTGSAGNAMIDVSCVSSTSCLAVGEANAATFAESWNGTAWTALTPPTSGAESNLKAVSCASATSCVAVGTYKEAGKGQYLKPLAVKWNGSGWTLLTVPSPSEAKGNVMLEGVSCPSPSHCTAAGQYSPEASGTPLEIRSLAEGWDGNAWTVQSSPNSSQKQNGLSDVSCSSAIACTAVGFSQPESSFPLLNQSALVERYE